jgi:glycosyltransferase involved in cell wall biosynthesis
MGNKILNDTTLTAIVRDEEDNPAHGIETWLRATLPYVERAVVVDTGSIDRTKEILEELKKDYPHLEIFNRKFDDFASSRNFSLDKIKTKKALILDADELLLPEEYGRLGEYVTHKTARGYDFTFKQIYSDGCILNTVEGMQITRLFDVKGAVFTNSRSSGFYEGVELPAQVSGEFPMVPVEIAIIKHFLPSSEAHKNKTSLWYEQGQIHQETPLGHAKTYGWKERNGGRNFYFSPESVLRENFPKLVANGS